MCTDDISLIHTEPTFRVCFSFPAINQQCVFDGVYDPDSLPRAPFLHWITEFLPFTTPSPPACIGSVYPLNQRIPNPEHASVRNTGSQVRRRSRGRKTVDRVGAGGRIHSSLFWVWCFLKAGW